MVDPQQEIPLFGLVTQIPSQQIKIQCSSLLLAVKYIKSRFVEILTLANSSGRSFTCQYLKLSLKMCSFRPRNVQKQTSQAISILTAYLLKTPILMEKFD